ncbi:UDP-4-amino-4,6-dideoxy-N-acetyl-beta-L-altrosamine transaminase [Nafulsella turpanensis]|uniref:UDP-4-amino-4, 6-dideoxy-N-acetyl-beta-L-altrosamine transaminase n=1 Tax=Nafulsella turpanensis TaxID=1265690 RepID=UPI00034D6C61|nr:UDP-4-amino-4,6-dideoxy-N-acetyl-beta-L-altrosamine transaminase [Nafulsella turpanensis]
MEEKKKYIPYGRQHISAEDVEAVVEALQSDFLTQGPLIAAFEAQLCKQFGCRYALVLNSGTSALHAAYFSLGLKEGDEFITTANTFVATANGGLYVGAKPVFADIEPDTGNINVNSIREKITSRTRCITPVHYAGHPADLDAIKALADEHGLYIIEDACHAAGARYKDSVIGSCELSDISILSFHPVKHVTTGEGGALLTNDEKIYRQALKFRTHGISREELQNPNEGEWYYEMQELGFNYRMTDLQAALGISQLKRLDKFVERRRAIAEQYRHLFQDNPYFDVPVERDYGQSSYHLYPIRLKDIYVPLRKDIFSRMRQAGLGVQVHYIPVYHQPYYKSLGYDISLPNTEDFYQREISLPMYPELTDDDLEEVRQRIFSIFSQIK